MPAELRSTSHGQTLVLTISNPDLRNALDPAIYAAGTEALHGAERSAEVRSGERRIRWLVTFWLGKS